MVMIVILGVFMPYTGGGGEGYMYVRGWLAKLGYCTCTCWPLIKLVHLW